MRFQTRLKELRIEKGVTQLEVAKILNMSKMAVSHWEKGNSEPSIEQLKILASFVVPSIFLGFNGSPPKIDKPLITSLLHKSSM